MKQVDHDFAYTSVVYQNDTNSKHLVSQRYLAGQVIGNFTDGFTNPNGDPRHLWSCCAVRVEAGKHSYSIDLDVYISRRRSV